MAIATVSLLIEVSVEVCDEGTVCLRLCWQVCCLEMSRKIGYVYGSNVLNKIDAAKAIKERVRTWRLRVLICLLQKLAAWRLPVDVRHT